ncbi:MAG TPA: hypothetical protein VGF30_01960 [Bacteroidia bacterium]
MTTNNTLANRDKLKSFFKSGSMPTDKHFSILIDSMYNKLDDTIPTIIPPTPSGTNAPAPSLFAKIENDPEKGMTFSQAMTNDPILQLKKSNIGTVGSLYSMYVNGTVAAPARVGTFTAGNPDPDVFADGTWKTILTGLTGLNAFEVVASASGPSPSGNYALLHAIALCTYGKSKSCIVQNSARYKGICKNIELRWLWSKTIKSYDLQIRTRINFGSKTPIKYNITKLICE